MTRQILYDMNFHIYMYMTMIIIQIKIVKRIPVVCCSYVVALLTGFIQNFCAICTEYIKSRFTTYFWLHIIICVHFIAIDLLYTQLVHYFK